MQLDYNTGLRIPSSLLVNLYRTCAWCGERTRGSDFHHWLVKRGYLPKKMYGLINVSYNVIPIHHSCHMAYGSTREMTRRCMASAVDVFGAENLMCWYNSVANQTHLRTIESLEDLL